MVPEQYVDYSYEHYDSSTLYLETPFLREGQKVYVDIYNDYDYAYISVDNGSLYLYDQWFDGAYEAHYVLEAGVSGYHYFQIADLHPEAVVSIYIE